MNQGSLLLMRHGVLVTVGLALTIGAISPSVSAAPVVPHRLESPIHHKLSVGKPTVTDDNSVTTATEQWSCVRFKESTNGKLSSNIYQEQGTAWYSATGLSLPAQDYSRSVQNWGALKVYNNAVKVWGNGWHPWRADWSVCHLGIGK